MRDADSITVDPHKSGYVPYPAGGLCYKDERSKHLITWTGPYIDGGAGDVASMGVYGLEGSKPGAAPVAAYISNEVIGLHRGGYGALLGEAMFTSVKMYAHWVTMSLDSDVLIVVPLVRLPAERAGRPAAEVEAQRRFVRDRIRDRPNRELVQDAEAMALVKEMGSDLSINAFACNFRVTPGGEANTDVSEASYLNKRIIERLSVVRVDDEARDKPVLLMGTELDARRYGACLRGFKRRLGLDEDDAGSLSALCNVSMTPFPTTGNFMTELAEAFQKVAEEEVQNCRKRSRPAPAIHSFVMQGTKTLHLTYMPMFNIGSYRQQLIVSAKLPENVIAAYAKARKSNPAAVFTAHTTEKEHLSTMLQKRRCIVDIHEELPMLHGVAGNGTAFAYRGVELTDITIIKHTSLAPRSLAGDLAASMPFFLHGASNELHLEHVILKSPSMQLTACDVQLRAKRPDGGDFTLDYSAIVNFCDMREYAMHPLRKDLHGPLFKPGQTFNVVVYADPFCGQYGIMATNIRTLMDKLEYKRPLARGTITFGRSVYLDDAHLNRHTVPDLCVTPKERLTKDELLLSVTEDYLALAEDIDRVVSHHSVLAAPDVDTHIMSKANIRGKFALQRGSEAVDCNALLLAQPVVHISRFALRGPSDAHSRDVAVRQGWQDAFNKALIDHEVRSANASHV
ncbi:hypothetical protein POSPLADRAFT_1044229 [Postia placenta MAD-698-R-SB12]|uniref:Uncharacterized protein n=1 Tax=Postia placenta MAD-698-R-SB12 TaxID=670580 RepID=A0A1X6N8R5_9APHY|nr:hypothetical protein POSPLADRAFT_1044229 [Postia placenta MAD-698-R-SB12]OSX64773.1 hypothetical protein POSPLADRAFT_1044229 [Postia placenta MAD-698-R-SB12]